MENYKIDISEPELLKNRSDDDDAIQRDRRSIAESFVQYVLDEIVKSARPSSDYRSPAFLPGSVIFQDQLMWVDVEMILKTHNPLHLESDIVEAALLEHPAFVTDGTIIICKGQFRIVFGIELYGAGIVHQWF